MPSETTFQGLQEARAPHCAKAMRSNPLPQGFGGYGLIALPGPACQPQSPTTLLHCGQRRSQELPRGELCCTSQPTQRSQTCMQGLSTPQAPPRPVAFSVAPGGTTWLCLQATAVLSVLNKVSLGMSLDYQPQGAVPLVGEGLLR